MPGMKLRLRLLLLLLLASCAHHRPPPHADTAAVAHHIDASKDAIIEFRAEARDVRTGIVNARGDLDRADAKEIVIQEWYRQHPRK